MDNKERIERILALHREGMQELLKTYMGDAGEKNGAIEKTIIDFEGSISREVRIVKKTLETISEALKEISDDLRREIAYLDELEVSQDAGYQRFVSREYSQVLERLLHNHERIEKKYRILEKRKETWKGILEKLRIMTGTYADINEKIRKQYEILEEIMEAK